MKICIAKAFAIDSHFAIIRSYDRQGLIVLGDLNIDSPDPMDGDEPEVPGENIIVDDDGAYTAFRDTDNSESDDSEEY